MDTLPQISDRFAIQQLAGSGGMGAVYRALDRNTGAKVALKLLLAQDEDQRARLAAEAEALAALDHPCVVRLVSHGVTPEGRPFLAMEWLEGEDLAARLERGPLSVPDALILGRRVAEGLAAAHARGIVHRDIKPSNLFLKDGALDRVKILDFGIARLGTPRRRLTMTGMLMGTPGYMAPEQARGTRGVDARADLFALGAVLFECLAGKPAFVGEHVMAVLAKLLLDEPPSLADLRPEVPGPLAALITSLLAKDPADRPGSAGEVAALLANLPARDAMGSVPPSSQPALTAREQRLVSVVAARPATAAGGEAPAAPALDATVARDPWGQVLRRLQAAATPLGARADVLLDGSLILTLAGPGVPTDQAARAARCAALVRDLAPDAAIALASGLGEVEAALPVGQILDRAATLIQQPTPGIRIDSVTASLLDLRFEVAPGPGGHELLGERPLGEGARTLLGRPSPCVGRERELRALTDLIDECARERVPRAALVTGPAGMGKSRLRHEIVQAALHRSDGPEVWSAQGDPLRAGSALALLGAAIRSAAAIAPGEPIEARRRKLAARVARSVPEADRARVTEFLGEIADASFPDSPLLRAARDRAELMVEQARRAFQDFVAAASAARPVLLIIEDLQWGDLPSLGLIDAALGHLEDRPFLVLALGRPEVHELFPRLWAGRDVQEIRLGPLTRRAAEELTRHALGGEVDSARVAAIVDRAGGNAFYLEEIIRAIAEGRGEALPETVLSMVQARLDALGPEERRVLRAASVFGQSFWPGGVAELLGGDGAAPELNERLAALCAREILARRPASRFPGEDELAFRHVLLRDGAYALLTDADRALGHRLAAAWLTRAGEEDPIVLAEHLERGGEPARAAVHYARAAEKALTGNDPRAAVAHAERALVAGATGPARLALLRVQAEARWFLNEPLEAERSAVVVLGAAPAGAEVWWSAIRVLVMIGLQLGSLERVCLGMEALEGIEATDAHGSWPVQTRALLAMALVGVGQVELAARYHEQADRMAARIDLDPASRGLLHLGRAAWRLNVEVALGPALEQYIECARWLALAGDRRFEAVALNALGGAYLLLGAYGPAEEAIRRALAVGGAAEMTAFSSRLHLARALLARGALADAASEARRALERVHTRTPEAALARAVLADTLRAQGALEDAAAEARAALDEVPGAGAGEPAARPAALSVLAAVELARGRPAEALEAAKGALGHAGPLQLSPDVELRARQVLVEALDALGDREGARTALASARDRLLAVARWIYDEPLRQSFLEAVPWNARLLALAAECG